MSTSNEFNAATDLKSGQMTVVNGVAVFKPVIHAPSAALGHGVFTLPLTTDDEKIHVFKVIITNGYEIVSL